MHRGLLAKSKIWTAPLKDPPGSASVYGILRRCLRMRERLNKTPQCGVLSARGAAVETQKRKFLSFRVTARVTRFKLPLHLWDPSTPLRSAQDDIVRLSS